MRKDNANYIYGKFKTSEWGKLSLLNIYCVSDPMLRALHMLSEF